MVQDLVGSSIIRDHHRNVDGRLVFEKSNFLLDLYRNYDFELGKGHDCLW